MSEWERTNANAYEVTGDVVVDGSLDEWNKSAIIVIDNRNQLIRDAYTWDNYEDFSANVYMMWDENNFYVGAEVTDDEPFIDIPDYEPHLVDSIEIYFSTDPGADPGRTNYKSTDFRLVMAMMDRDKSDAQIKLDWTKVENKEGIETDNTLNGYEWDTVETSEGMTFEAKVPLSNFTNEDLPDPSPTAETKIGFDVVCNDFDFSCPGQPCSAMCGPVTIRLRKIRADGELLRS